MPRMRVTLVLATYSGLADSLTGGPWRPQGVPAVYRLIEALARKPDLAVSLIFLARGADARFLRMRRWTIAELNLPATVLPWRAGWPNWLNELAQTIGVIKRCWRKADVVYATNAGYVAAGSIARLRIAPVVLRFLGIFPIHKRLSERNSGLVRFLYRAPLAHAVCTMEGSGAEYYLPRLLRPGVPFTHRLNGVDRQSVDADTAQTFRRDLGLDGRPVIAFLGRLEDYKGADEFVEALVLLERLRPGRFQALIVGDGPLRSSLKTTLRDADFGARVVMAGSVPHDRVALHLAAADIYVSLNRYGSISNANLEAVAAGKCMLLLEKDSAQHIDELTEQLIPPAVAARIARDAAPASAAALLADLLDNPTEITVRAARAAQLADELLESWDARVEREIDIIRGAAERRAA